MSDFDDEFDSPAHTSDGKARPNASSDERYAETAAEVQSFIERMDEVDTQIDDLRSDKKEIYAELKARGFNRKAFDATRKVINLRKDRSKVDDKLETRAIAVLYLTAVGEDDFEDLL